MDRSRRCTRDSAAAGQLHPAPKSALGADTNGNAGMVYDESGFDTTQSFLDKAAGARPTTHPQGTPPPTDHFTAVKRCNGARSGSAHGVFVFLSLKDFYSERSGFF